MQQLKAGAEYIHLIKDKFHIDFETGVITNLRSGKVVTGVDSYGYIQCHIGMLNGKRKMMKGHQMVYLMYYGYLPDTTIDHKDRCKTNNSIHNLREATQQTQARNRGCEGVVKRGEYYRARIRPDSTTQLEANFKTKEEALRWRHDKECELWSA